MVRPRRREKISIRGPEFGYCVGAADGVYAGVVGLSAGEFAAQKRIA